MPASERSLRITDSYRQRLITLRDRIRALAVTGWAATVTLEDLEDSHRAWALQTAATAQEGQRAAVRLTAGYLSAYVASELGRQPEQPPPIDESKLVGFEDGRPMRELLDATLVTVLVALAAGTERAAALRAGQVRAARLVSTAMFTAPRAALTDALERDDQMGGWRRVPRAGACLACLASAGEVLQSGEPLRFHDECSCTAEPVLADLPDAAPRRTGLEMFNAMPPAEQDARYGAKAALVREGRAQLTDFIDRSPMATVADRLTEAPLHAVTQ